MGPDRFIYAAENQTRAPFSNLALSEMGRGHLMRGEMRTNLVEMNHMESLVLLVEFADVKFTIESPKEYFSSFLNGTSHYGNGATGSAAEYLNDNFGAGYQFSFSIEGIVTLAGNMEDYGGRREFLNDADPAGMVREACESAASMGVDFSKYDHDKDGTVDNVAIIFAGYNEAESGMGSAIWPHYGNISNEKVELSGVKIGGYSCSSEYTGDNTEAKAATIGTFLHEFCHYLGLPDMYDVNGNIEGEANALYGSLSIMDAGNYLNGGNTPPCFTSIEREILSLDEVEELVPGNRYILLPLPEASRIYKAKSQNEGEYFLFECRTETGWDTHIGGSGMVVYHIDKSERSVAGLTAASRWEHNVINSFAEHECARVLPASLLESSGENKKATQNLFFNGMEGPSSLSYNTVPDIRDWNGGGVGIALENIILESGKISFATSADIASCDTLPYAGKIFVQPYQKGAFIEWHPICHNSGKEYEPAGNDDMIWYVTVTDLQGGKVMFESGTSSTYLAVSGLLPENIYSVEIHCRMQQFIGKDTMAEFMTLPVVSQFPYIAIRERYGVGDILHIDVQNLAPGTRVKEVKINGTAQLDEYYQFKKSGEYHVEVFLSLPDSSVEVINKLMKVVDK